jgi:hypothetical protein
LSIWGGQPRRQRQVVMASGVGAVPGSERPVACPRVNLLVRAFPLPSPVADVQTRGAVEAVQQLHPVVNGVAWHGRIIAALTAGRHKKPLRLAWPPPRSWRQ